jgi:ABC-type sugar transport system permease subunit
MKFINSFKSFAAIDVMTQGGPQGSSMVLGYWIYNAGRVKFNYGFAMVGAIILTIMVAGFTVLANKGFKREE